MNKLRLVIADDERPARMFLKNILQDFENVEIVGEAENGAEAIEEHARLDLGLIKPHETFVQMSTISTHYKPIYSDNTDVDLRTNEDELPPEQP